MYIPVVRGFISWIYHLQNVIYIHNKKSLAFLSLFNAETFANCYYCIIFPRITIPPFLPPHPYQTSSDSFDLIPFRSCFLYSITTYFCYTHTPRSQPSSNSGSSPDSSYEHSVLWKLSECSHFHQFNPNVAASAASGRIFEQHSFQLQSACSHHTFPQPQYSCMSFSLLYFHIDGSYLPTASSWNIAVSLPKENQKNLGGYLCFNTNQSLYCDQRKLRIKQTTEQIKEKT